MDTGENFVAATDANKTPLEESTPFGPEFSFNLLGPNGVLDPSTEIPVGTRFPQVMVGPSDNDRTDATFTIVAFVPTPPFPADRKLFVQRQVGKSWVQIPNQEFRDGTIRFQPEHLGTYQTFISLTAPAKQKSSSNVFTLEECFVYPNPVRKGPGTVQIAVNAEDSVKVEIYDVSGSLVHRATTGFVSKTSDGRSVKELILPEDAFVPGIYYGVVTATQSGSTLRSRFSFTSNRQ